MIDEAKRNLKHALLRIAQNETFKNYDARNTAVFEALYHAMCCGYAAGVRVDPEQPTWPVVFITLPTGQVSWHVEQFKEPWDSHTAEEKYRRVENFLTKW